MILDLRDPDPARRYKMITTERGPDVAVWFSPDGIHWKPSTRNPVLAPTGDTHSLLGWDERHAKFSSQKCMVTIRPSVTCPLVIFSRSIWADFKRSSS